jgi:hypothetical protein
MTTYPLAGVRCYYQETRYYHNGDYLYLVWLTHGKRVSNYRLLTTNELNALLAGQPLAVAA